MYINMHISMPGPKYMFNIRAKSDIPWAEFYCLRNAYNIPPLRASCHRFSMCYSGVYTSRTCISVADPLVVTSDIVTFCLCNRIHEVTARLHDPTAVSAVQRRSEWGGGCMRSHHLPVVRDLYVLLRGSTDRKQLCAFPSEIAHGRRGDLRLVPRTADTACIVIQQFGRW